MTHIKLTMPESTVTLSDSNGAPLKRQIAGLAVPYEIEAEVWPVGRLIFAEGSIEMAKRVPMLLGHDTNRPVGVLAEHVDQPSGVYARFSVDQTTDGDAALAQAQSGSRAGLSVGADIISFESLEEGELMRVTAARVTETSLVSLAAFDSAAVDAVAAAKPTGKEPAMSTPEEKPAPAAEAAAPPADERPNRTAPVIAIAERPQPKLRLSDYVRDLVASERGDTAARERVEAALTRETIGNNPGVIPIAYVNELVGGLNDTRPLFDAFSTAQMPDSGMTLRRPKWTVLPDGGWMVDDTAGAVTSPATIGTMDVSIVQWSWGGSASVALVERSQPSFVEEALAEAVKNYHRDVEATIAAELSTVVASGATTLGEAVADYLTTTRQYPNLIVAGATAAGKIIDSLGPLRYSSGSADATGSINMAGLRVITSPDVAAADAWVTRSDYIENRETTPIRLTVSDVTSLSLEIGVTSFFACAGKLIPNGAVRVGTFTPPLAADDSAKSRSGK